MGEASYILGIKIYRDRSRRMLGLTQSSYIEKVLKRFRMEHSKRGLLPMRHEIKFPKSSLLRLMRNLKGCRKHSVCCPVYQARCRLRFERNEQISGMRRGGALERGQEHS
ncbi:UNVERIFIED_CONTAM: hypothetical protein Slati_0869800 [Sesamum latifolium]|uniref:Uncharacterized protein n=1 Tax=Sesamum latifolium TaxID=2727402 RepID=A0AAW2XSM9_9LAMI